MRFPEKNYLLGLNDRGKDMLRPYFSGNQSVSVAAATVTFATTNNFDQLVNLSNMAALAQPGAGQIATSIRVFLTSPDAVITLVVDRRPNPLLAAAQVFDMQWAGEVLWFPRWTLTCDASFNALGVANGIQFSATGVLFPRGSFALQ